MGGWLRSRMSHFVPKEHKSQITLMLQWQTWSLLDSITHPPNSFASEPLKMSFWTESSYIHGSWWSIYSWRTCWAGSGTWISVLIKVTNAGLKYPCVQIQACSIYKLCGFDQLTELCQASVSLHLKWANSYKPTSSGCWENEMKLMHVNTQHTAWEIPSTQCECELAVELLFLLFQVTLEVGLKYCVTHSRQVVI